MRARRRLFLPPFSAALGRRRKFFFSCRDLVWPRRAHCPCGERNVRYERFSSDAGFELVVVEGKVPFPHYGGHDDEEKGEEEVRGEMGGKNYGKGGKRKWVLL